MGTCVHSLERLTSTSVKITSIAGNPDLGLPADLHLREDDVRACPGLLELKG